MFVATTAMAMTDPYRAIRAQETVAEAATTIARAALNAHPKTTISGIDSAPEPGLRGLDGFCGFVFWIIRINLDNPENQSA
jgi:hypothetical protein